LKEILELLIGKHFVYQFKNGLLVVIVKPLDKPQKHSTGTQTKTGRYN
jgi:hypothetical protein